MCSGLAIIGGRRLATSCGLTVIVFVRQSLTYELNCQGRPWYRCVHTHPPLVAIGATRIQQAESKISRHQEFDNFRWRDGDGHDSQLQGYFFVQTALTLALNQANPKGSFGIIFEKARKPSACCGV
jgi:hypothetical protein